MFALIGTFLAVVGFIFFYGVNMVTAEDIGLTEYQLPQTIATCVAGMISGIGCTMFIAGLIVLHQ